MGKNILMDNDLIVEYYSGKTFWLCRIADWSIMAMSKIAKHENDEDGNIVASTYFAWHIDKEFAEKIIENNDLFMATVLSDKNGRDPDLCLSTRDSVKILQDIRDEVKNGTRESLINNELENMLKACYMKSVEPFIEEYGNPPVFSKKKVWVICLGFILYPLGLPWFLAGRYLGGVIEIVLFAITALLGMITPIAIPFFALAVINVLVFYFRLFFSKKITDNKGLKILTKSTQKSVSDTIQRYNQYEKDTREGGQNEKTF